MIAKYVIEESVPYLKMEDNAVFALELMEEYKLEHLPVLQGKKLIGVIAEQQLLDSQSANTIAELELPLIKVAVGEFSHIFDVMKAGYDSNSSVLPVINHEEEYLGLITPKSLLNHLSQFSIANETGGIFVLEMEHIQYSLAEISRLVESNKASILSATTNQIDTYNLQVTIKVNTLDLTFILATLERHDYTISHVFHKTEQMDELKDHYDALMHYLDI